MQNLQIYLFVNKVVSHSVEIFKCIIFNDNIHISIEVIPKFIPTDQIGEHPVFESSNVLSFSKR